MPTVYQWKKRAQIQIDGEMGNITEELDNLQVKYKLLKLARKKIAMDHILKEKAQVAQVKYIKRRKQQG